jgi:hypothetical protein
LTSAEGVVRAPLSASVRGGRMEEEETGAQSGGRRRGGRGTEPQKRSRDFILVSEFSEHVGPVPVMVKPEGGAGLFNTSSFSVRIMSSDMQRALTGGCFSFSEDTQMVLSERMDGLYAYVHYFSLYDINARGYVRQLAISYITSSLKLVFLPFIPPHTHTHTLTHTHTHHFPTMLSFHPTHTSGK